jgi:uncharacterized protein YndB with AHSA1/START domain
MTPNTQELTFTRLIHASTAQVYAAFTTACGWVSWCCETAEAEAVLGGKLHIYTQGYNACGEFTRLEQDQAVAFTFNGDAEPPALITVMIEQQGEGCEMTFTVSGDWSEQDHPGFNAFLERTWGRVLDNLKAVLESK